MAKYRKLTSKQMKEWRPVMDELLKHIKSGEPLGKDDTCPLCLHIEDSKGCGDCVCSMVLHEPDKILNCAEFCVGAERLDNAKDCVRARRRLMRAAGFWK